MCPPSARCDQSVDELMSINAMHKGNRGAAPCCRILKQTADGGETARGRSEKIKYKVLNLCKNNFAFSLRRLKDEAGVILYFSHCQQIQYVTALCYLVSQYFQPSLSRLLLSASGPVVGDMNL